MLHSNRELIHGVIRRVNAKVGIKGLYRYDEEEFLASDLRDLLAFLVFYHLERDCLQKMAGVTLLLVSLGLSNVMLETLSSR